MSKMLKDTAENRDFLRSITQDTWDATPSYTKNYWKQLHLSHPEYKLLDHIHLNGRQTKRKIIKNTLLADIKVDHEEIVRKVERVSDETKKEIEQLKQLLLERDKIIVSQSIQLQSLKEHSISQDQEILSFKETFDSNQKKFVEREFDLMEEIRLLKEQMAIQAAQLARHEQESKKMNERLDGQQEEITLLKQENETFKAVNISMKEMFEKK